jgi:chlorite dismutase
MLLKKIVLRNDDQFSNAIDAWAAQQKISVESFDGKSSLFDLVDSMVIIQEDHNVSREIKDLREAIEKLHRPTHQIDVNATMSASVASLRFWLENNKPNSVLFVGEEKITQSLRFSEYLDKLAKVL